MEEQDEATEYLGFGIRDGEREVHVLKESVQGLEHEGVQGSAAESCGDYQAHCTSAELQEAFWGHRSAMSRERGTDTGARDGHTIWKVKRVKDNC